MLVNRCPSCQFETLPGAKYCDHCGCVLSKVVSELPAMDCVERPTGFACQQCGHQNLETARFCSNCGAALLSGVSPTKATTSVFNVEVGTLLQGRYRIEKELGRGGLGAVYRAWDNNLNRPCAVKKSLNISPEAQRQFMREAAILANLSHPHLPRVTDYFLVPDQGHYLVMDFVEGVDLASWIERQGAVTIPQAIERAMALEPGQRFQTAEEFKAVLKSIATHSASTVEVPSQFDMGEVRTVQAPIVAPDSGPAFQPVPVKKKNRLIFGPVGLFLLLCVCGFVGALAWIWNDQQIRKTEGKEETRIAFAVTQTTQNRRTLAAQAQETTDAYQRATDTALANTTATAQAQATLDVINVTATVLAQAEATQLVYSGELELVKKWSGALIDNFDQNSYDWASGARTVDWADITWTIADGVYRWDAVAKEGFVWWVYPEMEEYADFYYAVDLDIVQGPETAEQGLVYRMSKNGEEYSYYLYEISNNGYYAVWLSDPGGWSDIIPWTRSSLINANGSNRLALIAQGSRMVFFINDRFVAEVSDDRLSAGIIGLCIGLGENGQTGVWLFDNLEIRTP